MRSSFLFSCCVHVCCCCWWCAVRNNERYTAHTLNTPPPARLACATASAASSAGRGGVTCLQSERKRVGAGWCLRARNAALRNTANAKPSGGRAAKRVHTVVSDVVAQRVRACVVVVVVVVVAGTPSGTMLPLMMVICNTFARFLPRTRSH